MKFFYANRVLNFSIYISGGICIFGLILSGMLGSFSGFIRIVSCFFIFFIYILFSISGDIKRNKSEIVSILCLIYGVLLSIANDRSLIEILYETPSFSIFILFLPIVNHIYEKRKESIFGLIYWLCVSSYVLMLGQIIDYFIPLNSYLNIPDLIDADSTRRSYFLYASPTAIFALNGIIFLLVNRFFKHLSLPYLITLIASTFLSFSRLPFMLSIVLLAIFILLSANIYLKILVVTCLCFLISVKYDGILNYFDSYIAKLINVLSYDDYGNSIRIELWSEAFSKLLDYEFYLGHGFGSSNLNISRQLGTTYLGHFESTFFYYFIELGLFGVMLFLFAFFKSISACQTIFEKMVIIMFFANICVVPLMVNYQLPFVFWLSVALLTVTKTNQRIFIYEK